MTINWLQLQMVEEGEVTINQTIAEEAKATRDGR
jgi:hypothetical protein